MPTSSSQLLDKALDKYTKAKDLKDKDLETYSGDKSLLLTFRENGTDGLDGINEETSLIFEFQEDGKVQILLMKLLQKEKQLIVKQTLVKA